MKAIYATALAAAMLAAWPAHAAQTVDVSELSCKQFAAYDDDNKATIMMWFGGITPRRTRTRPSTSAGWRTTSRRF